MTRTRRSTRAVVPLITAFGTSADGLSRTFLLHVPAPFDIKGGW